MALPSFHRSDAPRRDVGTVLLPLAFVLVDIAFLYWVWAHFGNWGIWDWDYHESVLEVARGSLVVHGELPLWNRYMGGGATLIGNPLARPFGPSFLPVLLFGTIPGVKIGIFFYLLVGQYGMYHLGRQEGLSRAASSLGAILLTLSGCYAQHVTHGHVDWAAFWWMPLVVLAVHRATTDGGVRPVLAGAALLAVLFLDGGPYQLTFSALFLAIYAPLLAVREVSVRPVVVCIAVVLLAVGLAAVRLAPIAENFLAFPRPTPVDRNFYGMSVEPGVWEMLYQGYLSREQAHEPDRWMPFILNVGCYVGLLPLLLVGVALRRGMSRSWPLALTLAVSVLLTLGPAAPLDLWGVLHHLPGFSSLQVPARFNFFVLFALSLLAARGLHMLVPSGWSTGRGNAVAWGVVAIVTVDLLLVNAPVFKPAFSVRPFPHGPERSFVQHWRSPYLEVYPRHALYPLWRHWPNATYPTVLENVGVIQSQRDLPYPRNAVPWNRPGYRGEVWAVGDETRVQVVDLTPNRITVSVTGAGGAIVVNQNYDPGWTVVHGLADEVREHVGLLAFEVAPGDQTVTLAFVPRAFHVGLAVSAATMLMMLCTLYTTRRRA